MNSPQTTDSPQSYPEISIEQDTPRSSHAVYIRNLCKTYEGDGPPILEQLCMTVRKKTIYGLLGASGCGKTTILSCVVGLSKWDSGSLLVFGKVPGSKRSKMPGSRLGYMPQDIALFSHLTMMENIRFYCKIYNIYANDVAERLEFLYKLLDLPAKDRHVAELSGGQQRRVSLALALIHSPELLILDEPTVGLDPLLRNMIWNHLYDLVNTLGTTIIITTHYIEEARLENTIGVLRKGRLLVEDTPLNIIQRFRCDLLEQAVLQLCQDDKNNKSNKREQNNSVASIGTIGSQVKFKSSWRHIMSSSAVATNDPCNMLYGIRHSKEFDVEINQHIEPKLDIGFEKISDTFTGEKRVEFSVSPRRVYGLIAVILQTCKRYPLFLVIILLYPTYFAALTYGLMGIKPIGLNFGIVNHELKNWTGECGLPIHATNSCHLENLSCKFINELESNDLLILEAFETEEDALAKAHLGQLWGYIVFQDDYTQHFLDVAITKQFSLNESLEGYQIPVHLDHSQYIATFFMMKHLVGSYLKYGKHLAVSCGNLSDNVDVSPLHFRSPVYGIEEDSYMPFILPGVVLITCTCFATCFTAVIIITDRKQGTLDRARVAGINFFEVVASHLITQGAINIVQTVILGAYLYFYVVEYNIRGSIWLCLVINMFAAVCSASAGVLLGVVFRNEIEALILGVWFIPITFFQSGSVWPNESMSTFLRYVARILPTSFPVDALRSITIRGVGFTHSLVLSGFAELSIWTVVILLLSTVVAKYKRFA